MPPSRTLLLMLGLLTPAACAQDAIADAVSKLTVYADHFRATLPSLECNEFITIQQLKKGIIRKEMHVEGTFRVVAGGSSADPFKESHQYKTLDGKPAPEHFGVAFFLNGAFANGVGFKPEFEQCFTYQLEPGTEPSYAVMVLSTRPNPESIAGCRSAAPESVKRTSFDPATGQIFKVEVRTPAEIARRMKRPYFAVIEYAPVTLSGVSYLLPARVFTQTDTDDLRFEVKYSGFHRFGATVTVQPLSAETPQ